jgi:hypothetical protein
MSHLKNIILYTTAQGNVNVDVVFNNDTFWLTQKAMNCKKKQLFPFWKQFRKRVPEM